MHRVPLLKLLSEYAGRYPDERETTECFEQFVRQHSTCFERSLLEGHITGAAWILDRRRERVLLTHHRKLNAWLQPGGHADGDPDIRAVAAREADEETGLPGLRFLSESIFDLDIHRIPARGDIPEHLHYDVRFALQATDSEDYVVSDESHDLAWVPIEDVESYTTEESILGMVCKTGQI